MFLIKKDIQFRYNSVVHLYNSHSENTTILPIYQISNTPHSHI